MRSSTIAIAGMLSTFLFMLNAAAQQPNGALKGQVQAEDRSPVGDVSVTITDTKNNFQRRTRTDSLGRYGFLNLPTGNTYRLVFACVGYNEKVSDKNAIAVGQTTTADITLVKSISSLDDIIVIGYQAVKRRDITSAVSSVTDKDLKDFPVSTAAEALAGKLAGVSVTTSEGAPGADIRILIRSGTSISQDNSPLYIVDGVQMDRALSILSPGEIASIDVLKDVASTAIYGARGANGVVIITTKGSKQGRVIVTFDAFAGVRKITRYLDMMRPYDYVWAQYTQNRIHYNGGFLSDTALLNGFAGRYGQVADWDIYKSIPAVNWVERVFGRAAVSNTQILGVTGGTKSSSYSLTVNRTNEMGIMLNSGLARTFASFRFDSEVSPAFKIGMNARYSNQMVTGNGTSVKGSNGGLQNSVKFQPYDAASNLQERSEDDVNETRIDLSTPVTGAMRDQRLNRNIDFITSGYVNINLTNKLTFRSNIGYRVGDNDNKSFRGVVNYEVSNFSNYSTYKEQPYIDLGTSRTVGITNTNTLNYRTDFGKTHKLEVLLGEETNQVNTESYSQSIKFFPADVTWQSAFANVQQANPPQGVIQPSPTNNVQSERLLSYFGRTMYTYKNRYTLNLSMRYDGSSKFGPANKWAAFPSAQFAWKITQEPFFQKMNVGWVNNLKFRASYGTAGNNRVSTDRLYTTIYATNSTQGYAANDNSQTPGLYPIQLENPNLKWETTVAQNLGVDFDLFNSRLNGSVDVYSNTTNDLLLTTNIPQQNGYVQQTQNIGSTRNKGLEIQLNYQVVKARNWNYSTSFNITFSKNTILKLNQGGDNTYGYAVNSGWGARDEDFLVQVGGPVGQFYGYEVEGWYTLDDFEREAYEKDALSGKRTFVLKKGLTQSPNNVLGQAPIPGVLKIKDNNGDGFLTNADRTVLGTSQPEFYGGWNNQVSFRNFDMSVFFNYSYGNKTLNATSTLLGSRYQVNGNNVQQKFVNSWVYFDAKGEPIWDWDAMAAANKNVKTYAPTYGQPLTLSDAVEDASFLRITNITLGYTFSSKLLARIKPISKMRIYATVNNLHTFTRYTGFDPEASTRGTALTPGVDYSSYPRNRYFLAGINVSF